MARSTESTGTHADFAISAAGDAGNSRAEAFSQAERHSRRVHRLKIMLPLLAVVMSVGFIGYSYLSTPASVTVQTEGSAFTEGKLVMDSPKLEGFTKDGRPYSVSAARATQDFDKQDIISLDGIDAKMPVEAENWARVEATSGVYDRAANTLDVSTDILVTTTDGMVAKLKSAFLDIANGSLKSTTPIDIQSHGSRITADSMAVLENGKRVIFETHVRVYIDPVQMKAAQAARGDMNASN
ncbi:LPS export ABC transporter periplasmic protein LptC [Mesorhizobium sp. KR9-304]|uniref:LPS export ABC transporter periplasmic protein LptC n=1 Tax=Mesorhizobium sp. KR9-304 TaxID=3156614 RepID=UPI0032B4268E